MKLIAIEKLNPSTYNPRTADPKRLDLIELSLRKLGFLLPVYASKKGEILSGHQRHHVATRMGVKKVPVEIVNDMTLEVRKAINIAFNRGTNDLSYADTPKNITDALTRINLAELADKLPNIAIDSEIFYPCLKAKTITIEKLLKTNKNCWNNYARNMARMLFRRKITMPVVHTDGYKIINGIGRVQYFAEKKIAKINAVYISPEQAQLANAMLNYLSMDFNIHGRYEDLLRYNSFRRARRVRDYLGLGFTFVVNPNKSAKYFDINNRQQLNNWLKIHGSKVVDFGAGHLHETDILRDAGVNVTPFEPYRIGTNQEIDKAKSIALVKDFLADISTGEKYSSVFISSVLNSVPFAGDRQKIVCICAALCTGKTKLFSVASSTNQVGLQNVKGKNILSDTNSNTLMFKLDYEDNITIGDFGEKPKVQKYHSQKEFYYLFKKYFKLVRINAFSNNVQAICFGVRYDIVAKDLREALNFEFNLPYPDGSTMSMHDDAITAFKERFKSYENAHELDF